MKYKTLQDYLDTLTPAEKNYFERLIGETKERDEINKSNTKNSLEGIDILFFGKKRTLH